MPKKNNTRPASEHVGSTSKGGNDRIGAWDGSAVVMGGYSQVLFRLKGERWAEVEEDNTLFSNPAWMFPLMDDTPERLRGSSAGCRPGAPAGRRAPSCPV